MTRRRRRSALRAPARGVLILLLAALAAPLGAQRLPFTSFDVEDGLPSTQIWALRQDSRGLLWVGTSWGLARHDGGGFVGLGLAEGLPSLTVRAIVEDAGGALWFGTGTGVASYDGRRILARRDDGAPRSTVWAAVRDAHETLWFGTQDGLFAWREGAFRRFGVADGLPGEYVYALLVAADGALWVGTRGDGLARCEISAPARLAACRAFDDADGFAPRIVRALAEDGRGRIVAGARDGGLLSFDGERWLPPRAGAVQRNEDVYALLVRRNGSLVVGTADEGLLLCVDAVSGVCRRVTEANGLPDDGVRQLAEDREGALWVGTEGGLARLGRSGMRSYGESEGLPDHQVDALAADPDGTLWVGTFGGLARLRFGPHGEPETRVWRREDGLPGRWVWSILRDRRDVLWVGMEAGLCRMEGDRCEVLGVAGGLPSDFVLSLAEDPAGDLWVGTTGGLARLDAAARPPRVLRVYTEADGLPSDRAYVLVFDASGRLWAAHSEGLSWFDGERFRVVDRSSGLRVESVRALGLARDGSLLAGGLGHVARLHPGPGEPRFAAWGEGAGLEGTLTLNLAELDTGELILGTNRGVLLFDPRAGDGAGRIVTRIDRDAGAIGTEVTNGAAFARTPDDWLWFGFKKGLTGFPPPGPDAAAKPEVAIVELASGGGRYFRRPFTAVATRPIGWLGDAAPELPPGDRALRIEARTVSFGQGRDPRFQFRLAGHEADWSPPRLEPFREYMNLAPGSYVAEVRASLRPDEWSEPAAQPFVVVAAWWETRTAKLTGLLALAGALVILWRGRSAFAERQRRQLEARIEERTDDLSRYAQALAEHLQTTDRVNDRVRRAEAERRELFARTSHELRTPLTAILGFSELLERALAGRLEERERRYLANVRDGGEQLLRLVNNLLDQLKLEAGRMEVHVEEVDVGGVVDSVVSLMEGFALHRGVQLDSGVAAGLPPVRVDVAKLRQILLNLLSNAVKFSPAGATVRLAATAVAADESPLGVDSWELTVADRGPGIAAGQREAIFEPYRQLAGSGPPAAGTGLGLPIARQLTELLGGRLELVEATGPGATFRVLLPTDPQAASPAGRAVAAGQMPGETSRERVLVFEPDRRRFIALAAPLEREGLLAVRVADAAEAGRRTAELRPGALAVCLEPARSESWRRVQAALAEAVRTGCALSILAVDDEGLGIAMSLDAVLPGADADHAAAGAVELIAGGGRRPILVVAAGRETGAALVAALARRGADAFRIEGRDAVLRSLGDSPADALVLDLDHLLQLAPEVGGGRSKPAIGFGRPKLLLTDAVPSHEALARLAGHLRAEGGEAGRALAGSVLALLARRETRRQGRGEAQPSSR